MRKVIALALAGALEPSRLASFAVSATTTSRRIDAKLTPTKLAKKKFKPAKIFVDIDTQHERRGRRQVQSSRRAPIGPGSTSRRT